MTFKGYQPLIDHLTDRTPFLFRLSLGRNSDDLLRYVEERMAEVVSLGAVSYLEAHNQFGAVPLARPLNRDGEPVSYCVFVVREDSPLRSLSDLEGRSLALGSFHSTLSNLIARHELVGAGVRLEAIGSIEHLENDEAVAYSVSEGRFDVGAVEDLVASRYEDKGLRALHISEAIPSAPVVVREDLPRRVSVAIQDALLKLDFAGAKDREHWDEDIRYGFASASDADYEPIREIMKTSPTGCEGSCHGSP
jgi:phosphonate transport system substrate-binding protein